MALHRLTGDEGRTMARGGLVEGTCRAAVLRALLEAGAM